MMSFYYDSIVGLVYRFSISDVILDLEIIPKHFLDAKEVLDIFQKRGVLLSSCSDNINPVEIVGSISSNLFSCELPLPDNYACLMDEVGFWPQPRFETLEELALSYNRE